MESNYMLCVEDVEKVLGIKSTIRGINNKITNVCIDCFNISDDCLFIAINSKKYSNSDGSIGFSGDEDSIYGLGGVGNGHHNVQEAYDKGARFFIIDEIIDFDCLPDATIFRVYDSLEAIKELAKYYLVKLNIKVIAITGSIGKTSNTCAIFHCLNQKFKVAKFDRVRATQLGLAYDILTKLSKGLDFLIVEMQMDGKGQIDAFCDIVTPFISVLNTVSNSHVARFGGNTQQIFFEKLAVYRNLSSDGKIIVNIDSEQAKDYFKGISDKRIMTIGSTPAATISATDIDTYGQYNQTKFVIRTKDKQYDVKLKTIARQSIYWAMNVFAILSFLELPPTESIKLISDFSLIPGRMQLFKGINDSLVISDSYNANVLSMSQGIEYVLSFKDKKKTLILGSMLELGAASEEEHRKIGRIIANSDCKLITVGEAANYILNEAIKLGMNKNITKAFFSFEHVVNYLQEIDINNDDIFYIKGSGKMRLELITIYLLGNRLLA